MKRLFSVLIALLLLLSSAMAEFSPAGIWVRSLKKDKSTWQMITVQLNDDHTGFYMSQFFTDDAPGVVESKNITWDKSKDEINLYENNQLMITFYVVSNYRVSISESKTYGYYNRALMSEDDYDDALIAALPTPEPSPTPEPHKVSGPFGKWSCRFDAGNLSDALSNALGYQLIVFDLYLFENGSAYLTKADIANGQSKPDFSYGALSGVWLENNGEYIMNIDGNVYKAKLTDDGYLLLYMSESVPFVFIQVDTTSKMLTFIDQ